MVNFIINDAIKESSCYKAELAVLQHACYKVKLAVLQHACYKVLIVSQIFFKKLGYFQTFLKSTLYFDFYKTSTQTFHKITYNTIILARHAIKFLDINFLNISKILTFQDYMLSLTEARDKIKPKKALTFLIKRKFSVQKNLITLQTKITVL